MLIKYPNRRLYDTEASRYMTLTSIRSRVMEGEPVILKNSTCDITAETLVSFMLSDIRNGRLSPTADELRVFIRTYQGNQAKLRPVSEVTKAAKTKGV